MDRLRAEIEAARKEQAEVKVSNGGRSP